MTDLNISDTRVFEEWRQEEKAYLEGLQKEPITETLEMEYYQKLVNLRVSEQAVFVFTSCLSRSLTQS
jgi:hypothetical protein